MKKLLLLSSLLFLSTMFCYAQVDLDPSTFVSFTVRNKTDNSKFTVIKPSSFTSIKYIQSNSQIKINFDKASIKKIKDSVKIKLMATLIDKKGNEKPVNVFGFVDVLKNQVPRSDPSSPEMYTYTYTQKYVDGAELQNTEVDISSESLEPGDRLKITVDNIKGNSAFVMVFQIDDFGWTGGPSSGFAWLKTPGTGDNGINFQPAPWLGYSFYLKPSQGASVLQQIFVPSFGPEGSFVEVNNHIYVGLGGQVSIFANTVKVSYGRLLSYENQTSYFTIGLNFVNSIQTISHLFSNR
ncbi:hypothetical protein ACFGVR_13210 [Mucilaginibacter sp. AW1-3]